MKSLVAFSALFLIAAAHPNVLERAACNRDDCLRQVVASSAAPGNAKGSADCSSFFKKTLTPCPVTSTVTSTSTPVVSSTSTSTVSVTSTSTTVVSATSTETDTATATIVTTSTTTSTFTSVTTMSAGSKKRAIPEILDGLLPRAAAACTTVGSPSQIPVYASSCKGVSQYSSACSCNSVSMTTTTLAPVTSTNTATVTAAPSTTVVATSTSTSTIIVTETDSTTLVETVTTTSTATSTSVVSVTTTTTSTYIPAPTCAPVGYYCTGSSSCGCYGTVSGSGLCATNEGSCAGTPCNLDSDCGNGRGCLTACAGVYAGYAGSCANDAENACQKANKARSLLGGLAEKRNDMTLPSVKVLPS